MTDAAARLAPRLQRALQVLARHWLFIVLFLGGVLMRVIVSVAYRPVFIYFDSIPYLANAQDLSPLRVRPIGYALVLRSLLWMHDLTAVAVLQHLMGLAMAVLVYAVLLRYRAPAWAAALAAAPVLFDAYQLDIEHYVMSDTTSETLVLLALVLLVWRRDRLGLPMAAVVGLLIGLAGWVRTDTLIVVGPALLYVLLHERTWRRRLERGAVLLMAFLLPVLGYATWYDHTNGSFSLSGQSGFWLYGRVAPFADCSGLTLPHYMRPLCPTKPPAKRTTSNCFVWCARSPARTFEVPPGKERDAVLRAFSLKIIEHQPFTYLRSTAGDVLHGFAPTHSIRPKDIGANYTIFTPRFPSFAQEPPGDVVREYGNTGVRANHSLGRFLADYQKVVYIPGTVLGLLMLVGFAAAAGIGRARRSGMRAACLLFSLAGLVIVLPAALVSEFVWRYQLPQSVLLPAAGVLGFTALLRRPPATADVDRPAGSPSVGDSPTLPARP